MSRPLRVQYPGALYHVIARGNNKRKIFLDDKDRRGFLKWLKDLAKTHNLIVHAYCLMGNHYHLLVETPDGNLSTAMRDLNGNYSPQFVHWIWDNHTAGSETLKEHPREQRIVGRPTLKEIFVEGMTREERDAAIIFARMRCGYLTTEISKIVGLERSVVGRISRDQYNMVGDKKAHNPT